MQFTEQEVKLPEHGDDVSQLTAKSVGEHVLASCREAMPGRRLVAAVKGLAMLLMNRAIDKARRMVDKT
jgi:hypothetical protein